MKPYCPAVFGAVFLVLLLIESCGSNGPGATRACTPGASVACTCTDGRVGAQLCSSDGSSLGVCSCSGGGPGGTTASGGMAGGGSPGTAGMAGHAGTGGAAGGIGGSPAGGSGGRGGAGAGGAGGRGGATGGTGSSGASGAAGQAGGGGRGGVDGRGGQAGGAAGGTSGAGGAAFTGVGCSLTGYVAFTGDFDGDGTPDCALTRSGSSGVYSSLVSFYRGVGGGMYQTTPVTSNIINCATPPNWWAVADLDGDGRDDIVIGGDSGRGSYDDSLLLGHTDGTFQCGGRASIPGKPTPGVTIGDFTNDGHKDIFLVTLSTRGTNQVQWIVLSATGGVGSTQLIAKVTTPGFIVGALGSASPGAAQYLDGGSSLDVVVNADIIGMGDGIDTPQTVNVYGNSDGTFHCGVGQTVAVPNPTQQTGMYVCQSTGVYVYQP